MSLRALRAALRRGRHLSPFLVLGDPTPDLSVALAEAAVREGASLLEIGFPYGDPVADGPAIQAADERALAGGTSTAGALRILSRIRAACPRTPLNLLVYGNLVHARGYERFCRDAVEAGASSLLVPDIPLEEGAALRRASRRAGLGHVELVGPLTPPERLARLDRAAEAFLYLVATQGVTGARDGFEATVSALVARTVAGARRPVCLGFGLSRPEHVRRAFGSGARIAVVGSHLAGVIGRAWREAGPSREAAVIDAFAAALRPLVAAARGDDAAGGAEEPAAPAPDTRIGG
jgi:tryptophan synthase alpha chain